MADDKKKKGTPDTKRISLNEKYEVEYWTKTLDTTPKKLREIIEQVGDSTRAVRTALKKK